MIREHVIITKTTSDGWDLNPRPLVSLSGPQTLKPAGRQIIT
jgi:hypothetical protein